MDIDLLLRETGDRWRQTQRPAPAYDIESILARRDAGPQSRLVVPVIVAVAAAVLILAVVLVSRTLVPTVKPLAPASRPPATPSAAAVSEDQMTGVWTSSLSLTAARHQHRDLAGDWTLALDRNGALWLNGPNVSTIVGRWGLVGKTFTVALPFPGCPTKAASYSVDVSALRGLLELSPGDESCTARAIVLTGHWALLNR